MIFAVIVIKGCAMSGLIADSRTMVDKARVEAQVYSDFSSQTINQREPKNQIVHRKLNSGCCLSQDLCEKKLIYVTISLLFYQISALIL